MNSDVIAERYTDLWPVLPPVGSALVIGIEGIGGVYGAHGDAQQIAKMLRFHVGEKNYELIEEPPKKYEDWTRDRLRQTIHDFFHKGASPRRLLFFCGNADKTGILSNHEAMPDPKPAVTFDELAEWANAAHSPEVVVVLDCCYAGRVAETEAAWSIIKLGRVFMLSARRNEPAYHGNSDGDFSSTFAFALGSGAADFRGVVTALSAYSLISGYFTPASEHCSPENHQPVLRANVESSPILRLTESFLSREHIVEIATLFPEESGGVLQFCGWNHPDSRFEDEDGTAKAGELNEKQLRYRRLQIYRDLRLIETSHRSLWQAIDKRGVARLTPLGVAARAFAKGLPNEGA
jgi:hypothetical protein